MPHNQPFLPELPQALHTGAPPKSFYNIPGPKSCYLAKAIHCTCLSTKTIAAHWQKLSWGMQKTLRTCIIIRSFLNANCSPRKVPRVTHLAIQEISGGGYSTRSWQTWVNTHTKRGLGTTRLKSSQPLQSCRIFDSPLKVQTAFARSEMTPQR